MSDPADLVKRLRAYDKHNHRGKYAVLIHEAADLIERQDAKLRMEEAQARYAEWRGTDPNDYAFTGAGGRLVVMVGGKYQFMSLAGVKDGSDQ